MIARRAARPDAECGWRSAMSARDVGKTFGERLLEDVRDIVSRPLGRDAKLLAVCRMLADNLPHYDWVGFYLTEAAKPDELVLGPFVGEPTEHVRIPFGHGVCGQAAAKGETVLVDDVTKEANYLSCSAKVKSEIVVPIFKDGRVAGELDIDSHTASVFTAEDRRLLEGICREVEGVL